MSDTALLIIFIITVPILVVVIQNLQIRSNIPKVLKILRDNGAVDEEHAVVAIDVGLGDQPAWERVYRRRDFKPRALVAMINLDLVRTDDSGRVYINEARIAETIWADKS